MDNDGDGFGSTETVTSCQAEPGMFESDTDDDCNDLAIHINPGAADSICDGVNNDCTGVADDDDADGDGLTDCQVWAPGKMGLVGWLVWDGLAVIVTHSCFSFIPRHAHTHRSAPGLSFRAWLAWW